MSEADELAALAVKFEKAVAHRPKPQSPVPVFEYRHSPGQESLRKVTLME